MTKAERVRKAAEDLQNWIMDIGYEERGPLIDDCLVTHCKGCDRGAWLIKDIKHKKNCELFRMQKNVALITGEVMKHEQARAKKET